MRRNKGLVVAGKLLLGVLFAVLVLGWKPQVFKRPESIPFVVDVNQIATDPASGKKLCLGWSIIEIGETFTRSATVFDPDGDPMSFAPEDYLAYDDVNGIYTITDTPNAVGTYYYDVNVTDDPTARDPCAVAATRVGTFVLKVTPVRPNYRIIQWR